MVGTRVARPLTYTVVMNDVKLGALCWNQYTDWPSLLEAGVRADRLGYSSLWTWDHLYPIIGDSHGPIFEGWLTLAAWAQATERVRPRRPDRRCVARRVIDSSSYVAGTFRHILGRRSAG